ncbi:MAG: alpha-glucan family phosphorylase [Polyangiaceae bacterium]|nr:alpha-glucan family phosphorylase [Polyangiaceae bacterium]
MLTLHRYHVLPYVPAPLEPLLKLAKNLWWSWNQEARAVFARIDPVVYERVGHNPMALLAKVPQRRLDELARDTAYLAELERVLGLLDAYLTRTAWFDRTFGEDLRNRGQIAYFSMEFGVHESLPVYSGGLGVLAGDHLKSASDLGVPLVGIGIAFSQGYFRQSLDDEGLQHERYPPNDWHDLPVTLVTDDQGSPLIVRVPLPNITSGDKPKSTRDVALQAWRVDVGRVPLFLLDATVDANAPEDRLLTNTLYGGDRAHRIKQELLLGVGGVKLLEALGITPAVCHMNEGHSAFLAIERVRRLIEKHGVPFAIAREASAAGNVFTTHTPVPAGNDAFANDLIAPYIEVMAGALGLPSAEVMRLGKVDSGAAGGDFVMPVLAIRMADQYNGVSVLHGREARAMWQVLWPRVHVDEVPIDALTNGVHIGTWVGSEMAELYTRFLGSEWREIEGDPAAWTAVDGIPDAELWAARERSRARMCKQVRGHLLARAERRGGALRPGQVDGILDPRALTIGFARRFATYKRATLLFRDLRRLEAILRREDRPVQLVFSGKAHPQDWGGKELIKEIVRISQTEAFVGRVVFVEDYDMGVARELVSGVDVWLNTPRRPFEASGTSGMKAGMNGVLHASVLDGWWCEAYAGDNGFAIGWGEEHADTEHGDRLEAQSLYRLLEEDIVPLFYQRDEDGLPRGWIAAMKRSIATIAPVFNTSRMVKEYAERYYVPAATRYLSMLHGNLAKAWSLCAWKERVLSAWPSVRIESVGAQGEARVVAGRDLVVSAVVHLGALNPGDVDVDLYFGKLQQGKVLAREGTSAMRAAEDLGGGRYRYEGVITAREAGEHAFAVRVLPRHEALRDKFAMRLVAWQ